MKVWDVRKNSLDVKRIFNSGHKKRKRSLLCGHGVGDDGATEQSTEWLLLTGAIKDRGVRNLVFVTNAEEFVGGMTQTTEEIEDENETFCARSFLLDDALFSIFERVSNAGSPTCLVTRRR